MRSPKLKDTNGETVTTEIKKIDAYKFYFETPLYTSVHVNSLEGEIFEGEVDAYSPKNHIDTSYEINSYQMDDNGYPYLFGIFRKVQLSCKRKENDKLYFFILIIDRSLVKVGQMPSLADIQFAEISKKYDKQLSRDDLQLFKKAIGLAANGVGAGSFVYLRKIFETLIQNTYDENSGILGIAKEDFHALHMSEKIELLKAHLPPQLVEMKPIYGILSSGVHQLSEDECLAYFPALKLSIELILDQQIEKEEKTKRDKAAKDQIQQITAHLSRKK